MPIQGSPHTPTSSATIFPSTPVSFLPFLLLSHSTSPLPTLSSTCTQSIEPKLSLTPAKPYSPPTSPICHSNVAGEVVLSNPPSIIPDPHPLKPIENPNFPHLLCPCLLRSNLYIFIYLLIWFIYLFNYPFIYLFIYLLIYSDVDNCSLLVLKLYVEKYMCINYGTRYQCGLDVLVNVYGSLWILWTHCHIGYFFSIDLELGLL